MIKPFLIAVIIILSYIGFSTADIPLFMLPRLMTQDFLCRIKYAVSKPSPFAQKVVLVAIDDEAFYEYGKKWPLGRDIFTALIYDISKDKPAVIGMNLAFLGRTEGKEDYDLILKEAFRDAGNVIVASYFDADGKYVVPDEYFIDVLKDYGFTNKPLEGDKVIRYTKLFEPLGEESSPGLFIAGNVLDYSFEIKLLCAYYGVSPEDLTYQNGKLGVYRDGKEIVIYPADNRGYIFLNYTVKTRDLMVIPVLDIINNRVPAGIFKDRIVLWVITTSMIVRARAISNSQGIRIARTPMVVARPFPPVNFR